MSSFLFLLELRINLTVKGTFRAKIIVFPLFFKNVMENLSLTIICGDKSTILGIYMKNYFLKYINKYN
jgi:hypothetical protein